MYSVLTQKCLWTSSMRKHQTVIDCRSMTLTRNFLKRFRPVGVIQAFLAEISSCISKACLQRRNPRRLSNSCSRIQPIPTSMPVSIIYRKPRPPSTLTSLHSREINRLIRTRTWVSNRPCTNQSKNGPKQQRQQDLFSTQSRATWSPGCRTSRKI